MVLKALNTLRNFKLYLIYTILILFWELNQNSIQIFHHIQSSRLHIQSSEEIETRSAEASFKQLNQTLQVLKSRILIWMVAKPFGPLSKLQIGRHYTPRPFIDHQTLPLRYLTI